MTKIPKTTVSIGERADHLGRFRVKKGVSPYGGRILPGRWNKGRTHAILNAPTSAGNGPMGADERTYRADEVEEVTS